MNSLQMSEVAEQQAAAFRLKHEIDSIIQRAQEEYNLTSSIGRSSAINSGTPIQVDYLMAARGEISLAIDSIKKALDMAR